MLVAPRRDPRARLARTGLLDDCVRVRGSLAFTVVPTPLWAIYQRHDGYSTIAVTVAFAAYAVGVIVSLFLAGHLSDRLGRRRVLLPASCSRRSRRRCS